MSEQPEKTVFLAPVDLAERYGVTRSTINRWGKIGALPTPLRINGMTPRWPLATIQKWEAERMGESE